MMIKTSIFSLLLVLVSGFTIAQNLSSPNAELKMNFSLTDAGEPTYELTYKGKSVVKQSKLGLALKDSEDLLKNFEVLIIIVYIK